MCLICLDFQDEPILNLENKDSRWRLSYLFGYSDKKEEIRIDCELSAEQLTTEKIIPFECFKNSKEIIMRVYDENGELLHELKTTFKDCEGNIPKDYFVYSKDVIKILLDGYTEYQQLKQECEWQGVEIKELKDKHRYNSKISCFDLGVCHIENNPIRIEKVGAEKWAVRFGEGWLTNVLSVDGVWSNEPKPSERTKEFLEKHRFSNYESAFDAYSLFLKISVNKV